MDARLVEVPSCELPVPDGWRDEASTYFGPIRRFADSKLQQSIDAALVGVKHGALILHADGEGAAQSMVIKLGEHWSVVEAAYKPWNGKLEGEVAVRYSW